MQVLTPLTGEPLFAQLWYGEALNFGKIGEWNRQLDLWAPAPYFVHIVSCRCADCTRAGRSFWIQLAEEQRKENVLGIWVDEYVQRARAFQTASIARDLNGNWLLFGDALRTVRLPASEMLPEISTDIVGYSDRNNERYIYLARNHADSQAQTRRPGSN